MREAVVAHEVRALRAFSRAGAAQDVDYADVVGGEGGGGFGGGGEEGVGRGGGWRHCWFWLGRWGRGFSEGK